MASSFWILCIRDELIFLQMKSVFDAEFINYGMGQGTRSGDMSQLTNQLNVNVHFYLNISSLTLKKLVTSVL